MVRMESAIITDVRKVKLRNQSVITLATLDLSYILAMRLPTKNLRVWLSSEKWIATSGTLSWTKPLDAPATIALDVPAEVEIPIGSQIEFRTDT